MELSSSKIKKVLIFQEGICKAKIKEIKDFLYFHIFLLLRGNFSNTNKHKRKKFLILSIMMKENFLN